MACEIWCSGPVDGSGETGWDVYPSHGTRGDGPK